MFNTSLFIDLGLSERTLACEQLYTLLLPVFNFIKNLSYEHVCILTTGFKRHLCRTLCPLLRHMLTGSTVNVYRPEFQSIKTDEDHEQLSRWSEAAQNWFMTGDAYSSGQLALSLSGLAFFLLVETSDTLYRLDTTPVRDIITGLDIFTESDISTDIGFHRHLQPVWQADRGCLLLRKPGPVSLRLAYVLFVETNPFSELVVIFRTMLF